jgi:hypothetical protein
MKEKTLKLVNNKLDLLEKAIKGKDEIKCLEIYNSIPGTGWVYFIDEIVNRGLGRIEGAFLKWSFE